MDIHYTIAKTDQQLHQILDLQQRNLPGVLNSEEKQSQGFVTVEHDFRLLKEMNSEYPHAVALADEKVIGYALVMLPEFRDQIEILIPMFNQIDKALTKRLELKKYFIMGQVCVSKAYRGKGVFYGLYDQLKVTMSSDFACCITEVDPINTRSIKAHRNQGFKLLERYMDEKNRSWDLIYWDWT
ncbi:MAG: GNAT family N-acetyltransferase [Saprospiraceae bacterium]|nr:GNAT family N-acetyltransferase [Saprospiraceae bacterium]